MLSICRYSFLIFLRNINSNKKITNYLPASTKAK